jgi:3-dehydro-L-gulonate 2-dehydrogenase
MHQPEINRVSSQEAKEVFQKKLLKYGMRDGDASVCASVFTENSMDGVYSHGFNRFPRFIQYIKDGYVRAENKAQLRHSAGGIEQWDGMLGPGPVNAFACTDRAIELAEKYGIGCVALANTNHWMRGGTYGWRAAKKGCVFIGWSNTIANMPPWGAKEAKLGNNPLVIAVPHDNEAIVLDMAMSQYSYGALEVSKHNKKKLPVAGGFDSSGELSFDPEEIIQSRRPLPIGYWKGSGLSLLLDVLATILSAGLSTSKISELKAEHAVSQVFIAIDVKKLHNYESIKVSIDQILEDYHQATPDENGRPVRYPGEQSLRIRKDNLAHGIPIPLDVWESIKAL